MPVFETSQVNNILPPVLDVDDGMHSQNEFEQFKRDYLAGWNVMLETWQKDDPGNRMWLMYAASYLFRTGRVRWAVDPQRPNRLLDLPDPVPLDALKNLSFVLLTHDHADHYDPFLLSSLVGSPVRLIVPETMATLIRKDTSIAAEQIITAVPNQSIILDDIRILPFDGWHSAPDNPASIGYPATGYLVKTATQRWLFPADVRDYQAADISTFKPIDCLFAHLWLGRQCALMERPPLVEPFCDYLQQCAPRRIVLAHLYEFSRPPVDLWHRRHLRLVIDRCYRSMRQTPILVPRMYEGIEL